MTFAIGSQSATRALFGRQIVPVVFARRGEQKEVHRAMRGEGEEDLHLRRGERGDAEDRDPLRPLRIGGEAVFFQAFQHRAEVQLAAAVEFAPERRLPCGVAFWSKQIAGTRGLAFPFQQHLGTINQVLIKQRRKPRGELVELEPVVVRRVGGYGSEFRAMQ